MNEAQLRALGCSAAKAKQIMALPIETRYFDLEDLPISVTALWKNGRKAIGIIELRAWAGSRSWP